MSISLNQLKNYWKALALSHQQVKSFSWGAQLVLSSAIENSFPLVHVIPGTATVTSRTRVQSFTVLAIDSPHPDDWEMLDEIWSDTQQILLDFKRYFENADEFYISGNTSLSPVLEDNRDRYSGWQMQISLEMIEAEGTCELPINFTNPFCQ